MTLRYFLFILFIQYPRKASMVYATLITLFTTGMSTCIYECQLDIVKLGQRTTIPVVDDDDADTLFLCQLRVKLLSDKA